MAGEYRQESVLAQIDADWVADIKSGRLRIALTNQPIIGLSRCRELIEPMAAEYARIGMDKYAEGLRSGAMIPVWDARNGRVWAPGELFMTS